MSIVQALMEQVQREVEQAGQPGRVTRLDLQIGRMSGVHVDAIRFAFEILTPGTTLEKTALHIDEPAARLLCQECGHHADLEAIAITCPACGSNSILIQGGQELVLQSIELTDDE